MAKDIEKEIKNILEDKVMVQINVHQSLADKLSLLGKGRPGKGLLYVVAKHEKDIERYYEIAKAVKESA